MRLIVVRSNGGGFGSNQKGFGSNRCVTGSNQAQFETIIQLNGNYKHFRCRSSWVEGGVQLEFARMEADLARIGV
ncbi:hypothetical protein [Bacillus sp. MUM 13]|uniref:hypothetical protein n=1 Tax=Bacillus sp. MUM 13 TaxID=1678001 RepID=UPI0008F55BAC|nr:hypothetical protein [Bacillus sp. MUM 13]OIK11454.1 hypothetical protein BIV59_12370 [Bacillus sp. MUM 13]